MCDESKLYIRNLTETDQFKSNKFRSLKLPENQACYTLGEVIVFIFRDKTRNYSLMGLMIKCILGVYVCKANSQNSFKYDIQF